MYTSQFKLILNKIEIKEPIELTFNFKNICKIPTNEIGITFEFGDKLIDLATMEEYWISSPLRSIKEDHYPLMQGDYQVGEIIIYK